MKKGWQPGQSGNPAGRPRNSGKIAKLREEIAQHLPTIIAGLIERAKDGDPAAARLLLERVCPAVKPVEQAVTVALTGDTLTERGNAVLAAIEAGTLAPSQGAALLTGIGTLARVTEIDELAQRVDALETQHEAK
jgi:hypothetical protein